jgi:hypothetical protein
LLGVHLLGLFVLGFSSTDEYRRAKKVVAKGVPELVQAMDSGEVSVSAAARIAGLPPEKQKGAVEAARHRAADVESAAVDGWGIPIQEHARAAFGAQPLFDELLSLLRKADRLYSQLADHEGGAYLRRPGVSVNARDRWKHKGLKDALLAVQDCRPTYTVCPYAFSDARGHPHDEKCNLCHGLNWVRPLGKEEVPHELIAKAKEAHDVRA